MDDLERWLRRAYPRGLGGLMARSGSSVLVLLLGVLVLLGRLGWRLARRRLV